ncbi:glycosyltransferase family 2 protein [Halothece sp. PCC 7418]|uniref:glycosyltransferase family 2 protein n=1 Tax=Halothece sp. (strain PCC 7418) TaxID=65093 RepID=UPI00059F921D|nr:glycosyltransferase family 2 protein [Halothece sp. PCC 7418]
MSPDQPRVSIGLPVYNGERFLRETLDSILAQTFEEFELIISDNASTDKTAEICQEYLAKDQRVRYFRNSENLGAARNYNRTFELATGQYFKWAAGDDLLAPEYLERCVAVLDRAPSVVLCYTAETRIDASGKPLRKSILDRLNLRSPTPAQRFQQHHRLWYQRSFMSTNPIFGLIRVRALQKTPLIGNYVWSELALLMELMLLGEFYEVPEHLFFFRWHPKTSRATRESAGWEELAIWFDPKNKGKIVLPEWGLLFQQLASIQRVPMSFSEKVFCYLQVGKWFSWKWKKLAKELMMATGKLITKAYLISSQKLSIKKI